MKQCLRAKLIILSLLAEIVGAAIAEPSSVSNSTAQIETKVTRSKENGKYKRIRETFRDKVLVSLEEEVDIDGDGRIEFVITKLFREGEMTYACISDNIHKNTVRCYSHKDKLLAEEVDEDGDGFFETIVLFDANEQPVEAFGRSKDGTVTHLSAEKMAKLKKGFSLIN
jgi:hypothetical protein